MNKTRLEEYWNKYKADFGTDKFKKSEGYKWSLFGKMYPIWKWKKGISNIEMYENTFKVDGPKNLWMSGNFFPISMLTWMLEKFPEESATAMEILFDETKNLSNRIDSFTKVLDDKLPELAKLVTEKPINHHYHGDLRAISLYLTLQFPEKYFIYKHTMYKAFSEIMELPKVKTGKTSNYEDYIGICNEIREFIKSDTSFIAHYKSFLKIEEYYDDPYLHLLVQDFILSVSTYEPSYWIFQGNPKVYDFSNAINNGIIDQWTASAHRDKMRIGDKVIFWLTGTNSGCYALGEITSDPFQNIEPKDEFWKGEDKSEWKVGVKISHNCSTNPILKEQTEIIDELTNLNVGNQGTNFLATNEQFSCLMDIINSSESTIYAKIKRLMASDKMNIFLGLIREFVSENNLDSTDSRISLNVRENKQRLVFVIGSRYSLCIEKIKNDTIISFISPKEYDRNLFKPFTNNKGEIEAYWNLFDPAQADTMISDIKEGLQKELSRNNICPYRKHSNSDFNRDIFGEIATKKYWLYAPGENASMWDEFLQNGVMGLGWDELGNLNDYSSKEEIANRLQELSDSDSSKANDATANFDFKESINIGDVIIAKKGRSAYLGYGIVTSNYYYDETVSQYKHKRKVNWIKNGLWESEHSIALKTLTDITNIPYKPNPSILAPKAILDLINASKSNVMNQQPINQILYGPPGTGKTFKLKDEYFSKYSTKETSISSEQHLINIVSECSWWQVIAIALIQSGKSKVSDIANHNWVIQKAALSNSNTIRPTIWGQLQSHTVDECEFVNVKSKQQPYIFNKTHDSFWEIVDEEVKERVPELYEIIDSVENFRPSSDKEIQRYVFTTFHQSYSYEDFIEGIKPVMIDGELDGNVDYHIEDGVFKQLCKKAEMDPENKYAIFIDEINRGNVSSIFGELITLIEQDKRKGAMNAMSVVLPYSKTQFSVPNNVDVFGTMNTADRSVEALDTALRRRFSFIEMLPKPALLKDKGENGTGKIGDIDLEELLITINDRIEALVDRDHTIGHAFFMDVYTLDSLRSVFANKVIPLLQEYFYGDYAKMEMVIGPDFFNSDKRKKKVTFAIQNEDVDIPTGNYELMNILDPTFNFVSAINRLLNRKVTEVEVN
jgi:hypothetical protein